jgi:hypothetical protein
LEAKPPKNALFSLIKRIFVFGGFASMLDKAAFEKYPGLAPVELVYLESGRARRVRTNFCVDPASLFRDEIVDILGEESVS